MKTLVISLTILLSLNSFAGECTKMIKDAEKVKSIALGWKAKAIAAFNLVANEHDRVKACEQLKLAGDYGLEAWGSYILCSGKFSFAQIICESEEEMADANRAEFFKGVCDTDATHQENVNSMYAETYDKFCK